MIPAAVVKPFSVKDVQKYWGVSRQISETETSIANINYYIAGQRGALQYHIKKEETLHLVKGEAVLWYVDLEGHLTSIVWLAGHSFHVPPGAVHQVQAITDCVIFEVSTPVFNDRVNVEEEYKNAIG